MIKEAATIAAITLLGMSLSFSFRRDTGRTLACAIAFPLGLFLVVTILLVMLLAGIEDRPAVLIAVAVASTLGFGVIAGNRQKYSLADLGPAAITVASAGLLALIAAALDVAVFSYDSHAQLLVAKAIPLGGTLSDAVMVGRLFTWGMFLPALQSLSVHLEIDYLSALQPCISASFCVTFVVLVWRAVAGAFSQEGPDQTHRRTTLITFALSSVVLSSYFVLFAAFYIHNNMITATFLFSAVSLYWLSAEGERSAVSLLPGLFFAAFALCRVENMATAFAFLVPLLCIRRTNLRRRLLITIPMTTLCLLWYGTLLYKGIVGGAGDSQIASPSRLALMLTALIVFQVLVLLMDRLPKQLVRRIPAVMVLALGAAVAAFTVARPVHLLRDLLTLGANTTLILGRWGFTWIALAAAILVVILRGPRGDEDSAYGWMGASFLLLLLFFSFFRKPFRFGWGDSANRIMMHLLPVAWFYVALKLPSVGGARKAPDRAAFGGQVGRLAVYLVAALFICCLAFVYISSLDRYVLSPILTLVFVLLLVFSTLRISARGNAADAVIAGLLITAAANLSTLPFYNRDMGEFSLLRPKHRSLIHLSTIASSPRSLLLPEDLRALKRKVGLGTVEASFEQAYTLYYAGVNVRLVDDPPTVGKDALASIEAAGGEGRALETTDGRRLFFSVPPPPSDDAAATWILTKSGSGDLILLPPADAGANRRE